MFKDKEELSALQEFKSGRLYPTLRVTRASRQPNTVARGIRDHGALPKVHRKPCAPGSQL